MKRADQLMFSLIAGVLGTVTAGIAQRLLTSLWRSATGSEPPAATDPDTPTAQALTWALASGVGIGVAQLLVTRLVAAKWAENRIVKPEPAKVSFTLR